MTTNTAMVARPTVRQRIARRLGFKYHLGDTPRDAEQLPGWMKTDVHFKFGFADRLRLFLSGRLDIAIVQHTPVECAFSKNRTDWHIRAPFDGER